MNITIIDGDRYMSILPPSSVIKQLVEDELDRGNYKDWNPCVVKDKATDLGCLVKDGTITWCFGQSLPSYYKIYTSTKHRSYLPQFGCRLEYRPCLVPLDKKGQKLLDHPICPNWTVTEGGTFFVNREPVSTPVVGTLTKYDRVSIRNTMPNVQPMRWVWMDGYMVCINRYVVGDHDFFAACRWLH